MELYEEILMHWLKTSDDRSANLTEIVNLISYQTLQKIKAVIEDDSLDDPECFAKIEKIICAFENIGSGGGFRHDFG